jgi:hypothetical protein
MIKFSINVMPLGATNTSHIPPYDLMSCCMLNLCCLTVTLTEAFGMEICNVTFMAAAQYLPVFMWHCFRV